MLLLVYCVLILTVAAVLGRGNGQEGSLPQETKAWAWKVFQMH